MTTRKRTRTAKRSHRSYTATAELLAVLLESDETPEPLRGMLYHVVEAYRFNMTNMRSNSRKTTPAFVRRRLPYLMLAAERAGFVYSDIGTTAVAFSTAPS